MDTALEDKEEPCHALETISNNDGEVLMKPRFTYWTLLGYQIMVMASWSNYLITIGVAVDVGGPVGFLYGTLVVGFFQQLTVFAISELASAWPHPGGPMFWTTKLAPEKYGPAVSFFMGWITVLAYTAPLASAGFSSSQVLSALITQIYGYEWTRWQLCFLYWGIALTCLPVSLRPKWMPAWSAISLVCFLGTMIATIALWASHIEPQSAEFVFKEFSNNTGWKNDGFVFLLSLIQTSYAMSGLEAATHMSFETKNPRRTVPQVLISSVIISTLLCFGFAILLLYALGPLDDLIGSSLGAIYLQLYVNAAGEAAGLGFASFVMFLLNLLCGTQLLAAGARVVWSLARMGCIPYAQTFEIIDARSGAPIYATLLTLVLSMLFGLLYIASETAWNAIVSCTVTAFEICYIGPLIILLIRGRSILPARYLNLDKIPYLGFIINLVTVLWGLLIIVVSLFPVYMPVGAETMNYTAVVIAACALLLFPYWFFSAKYSLKQDVLEADMMLIVT